jgi:hypothetical protein
MAGRKSMRQTDPIDANLSGEVGEIGAKKSSIFEF